MSKNLISASLYASVRELGELLFERDIGHVPILDGDRVAGIVTRADILAQKKRERERREAILAAGRPAAARA
jgi:tRNA nucleotidyltransferase (CCA-adding enzyme)